MDENEADEQPGPRRGATGRHLRLVTAADVAPPAAAQPAIPRPGEGRLGGAGARGPRAAAVPAPVVRLLAVVPDPPPAPARRARAVLRRCRRRGPREGVNLWQEIVRDQPDLLC